MKKCLQCGKIFYKKKHKRSGRPCGYQWETEERFRKRKFCDKGCYVRWQQENPQTPVKVFKKGHTTWNKGKPRTENTKEKVSRGLKEYYKRHRHPMKGKKAPWAKGNEHWKQRKHTPRGEEAWNWKGGITEVRKKLWDSPKYKKWRKEVFERDDYTCQNCGARSGKGKSVSIEVHHIKQQYKIFEENNIKTLEDALNCEELWDKNNAITLCKKCHNLTKNGKPKYI